MRLTSFTDYSLRVLIYLAAEHDRRATIAEIATAFDVSEHHLTKVAHFLGKAGLLANVRGRGGGLELARRPEEIRVGDVVRAAEGPAVPAECFEPGAGACPITRGCVLRGILGDAVDAFYDVLDRRTLADLVPSRATMRRVLKVR